MIRYERKQLKKWWNIIWDILTKYKLWLTSWGWNLNSKKIWLVFILLPIIISLAYSYMWIQNAFTPYSTAWDANHEYMYIPKILAENAWIYWWNTVASNMPWFWHQFLTFIFSLTGCTNWWFGLSPDNIAISMNNISAFLVLIFWIAIVFQIFTLINKKEEDLTDSELKKWNKGIVEAEISNSNWITMWWYILLLRLTGWMWAFLVIVDNKTDLWVMALSLLALLAGLIFLQNRKSSKDRKEILKYLIIAWLFFWFAALAKITAFVDLVLFAVLLMWLRFSPLTSLWIWVMVMWIARKLGILTSSVMLTDENATWFMVVWLVITVIWLVIHLLKRSNRKEFWRNFIDLVILWIWFIAPLVLLKLPRSTVSQLARGHYSFWSSLKAVFLSMDTEAKKKDINKFLAQSVTGDLTEITSLEQQDIIDSSVLKTKEVESFKQCSAAWDIYSEDELNENLQVIVWWGGGEDLWRYIWYGWKEFKNSKTTTYTSDWIGLFKFFKALWPKSNSCWDLTDSESSVSVCEKNLMYWIMKLLWPTSDTCYWLNHDAKVLCNNADVINNFKIDDLRGIYENWINNKEWEVWLLLKEAIDAYDKAKSEGRLLWSSYTALFHDEIVKLRQYYQSHSISSDEDSVNIPYRYLVPLNISFNWSLQNLSSYYTDIGFIWIIIYVFLLIALPYAIIKKDKVLTSVSLTTLIWWWIWWIIWSSILWYGTVLISWTMITIALVRDKILDKNSKWPKIIPWVLIAFVWIFFWVQLIFNFVRIASQWANSVFVWYKWNVGKSQVIDDSMESSEKKKYWYWWKNIFDLQFPQYNPIINALADRNDEDWVIIAWTYIQYFLWNQWNIKSDWMLSSFWRKTSDWDLCKTYRRLKKDNTRYFIIDPNIGTVTMWEWNETLFYRFFGKLNSDKTKIEIDWTITTLIRLAKEWYLKLLSTNNIWSKYAFTVDDATIRMYFGANLTDDELILTRAKMAVLQYFDDANSIFSSIAWIFLSRIMNDTKWWIEDIANIYWYEIDSDTVASIAASYINWQTSGEFVKDLTQNERLVLLTYINLYLWYKQRWESAISSQIQSLLLSSVTWGSQIIALELN